MTELEKKYYDDSLREVQVDEVIRGNVLQGAERQISTRQSAMYAGIPK